MKYIVETTKTGYVETLEVDGKEYKKTWHRTDDETKSSDDEFYEQLKKMVLRTMSF